MIIEGDWTHLDEIPYIESEMIIEQPIIRSQGKNLLDLESKYFNPSNVTYTKSGTTYTVVGNTENYNYGQFAWTTETSAWFRNLLGKEVTLSVSSISCTNANSKACIQVRMECTDGSKVYKTISTNDDTKYETFTIPSNAIDMALQLMSNNTGSPLDSESTLTVSNIQLELGNTATSYEPYKHQTLYSNRVIGYEEGVHYGYGDGVKYTNANYNSVMADVEGLSIVYVTNGSSNFTFWDKDGTYISGKGQLDTALSLTDKNGFITVPTNAKYMKFASSCATGASTDYTKATVTGDLPLRSLPNGVCDTLNLVTGEYVQRVGEIVLDGSENWGLNNTNTKTSCYHLAKGHNNNELLSNVVFNTKSLSCDRYSQLAQGAANVSDNEGIFALSTYNALYVCSNIMSTSSAVEFKQYLSQNPITVQYQLATPIVRKLGFTTKGNFQQASLGDYDWAASPTNNYNTYTTRYRTRSANSLPVVYNTHLFSDDFHVRHFNIDAHQDYEYISNMEYGQYVCLHRDKLESDTVESFKKWLAHNPITVGYISYQKSSDSYSNIHKPIFFNNVNVKFLENNINIQPQLTLQARTMNSYIMDMMKPNTTYTMKCLAYSNSAKLWLSNGTANTSVSSNKAFYFADTSLSKANNQLVIVGQWYEPMIIEGDVTGKNLPYFKGILSSYHDVDEIEIYSKNKNLFDGEMAQGMLSSDGTVDESVRGCIYSKNYIKVEPNKTYYFNCSNQTYHFGVYHYDKNHKWVGTSTTITSGESIVAMGDFIRFRTSRDLQENDLTVKIWVTTTKETSHILYQYNTTLIEMPTRLETVKVVRPELTEGALEITNGAECASTTEWRSNFIPVQPNEFIKVRNSLTERLAHIDFYDINKNFISYSGVVNATYVPDNCYFIRFFMSKVNCSDLTITRQAWKPIQLNSLPNGVYDEIIMKPNSNKVQLVQRVGKVVLDGIDYPLIAYAHEVQGNDISCTYSVLDNVRGGICQSDKLLNVSYSQNYENIECIMLGTSTIITSILKTRAYNAGRYLKQNPITVYYELATPIIHEIQLKGYPHVYENGTVTLNTDTPHQTLVSYNVNQEQLINTQNETIIRHDQQIDDLYYYIEMYLEEIYQMELFRMKLELSL